MKEKINTLDNKTLKEIDLDKSIFSIELLMLGNIVKINTKHIFLIIPKIIFL